VSPKRFNPANEAWLPVMHLSKDGWHFTALYSNSALAHELDRTRDWVVIYCYDDRHHESQHTVVSETRGTLAGRRVVRGRESECLQHYAA
jgi:putative hydrolase